MHPQVRFQLALPRRALGYTTAAVIHLLFLQSLITSMYNLCYADLGADLGLHNKSPMIISARLVCVMSKDVINVQERP